MKCRHAALAALVLSFSGHAYAADHIMRVGEILLSNGGNSASQFVELEDQNNEPFPSAPYSLVVFDAAGTTTGSQVIIPTSQTLSRLIVASAQARTDFSLVLGPTVRDLTLTLPANGTACFAQGMSPGTLTRFHCVTWGTVTSTPAGIYGNSSGPAPTDSLSLQRIPLCYAAAAPTPNTVNAATCPAPPDAPPDAAVPDAAIVDAAIPDAAVPDASVPDAAVPGPDAAVPDATDPGMPPAKDDGCLNVSTRGASWFLLVVLAGLAVISRRAALRRRRE